MKPKVQIVKVDKEQKEQKINQFNLSKLLSERIYEKDLKQERKKPSDLSDFIEQRPS